MTLSNLSRLAFVAALLLLVSPAFASAGGPNVTIDYLGATEDPQRNDFVFVRALASNNEAAAVRTRIYLTVNYPDGRTRTYSVLSTNIPAMTSFQVQKVKRIKIPVPADAPAGTYNVTLYAADDISNGGAIYDTDTFQFTLGPIAPPVAALGGPNVTIDYLGATEDPQRNDFVFVRALASNNEAAAVRTRIYLTVNYPDGRTRTYSVLSTNIPAMTSFQVQKVKRIKIPVPADAPAGTYNVTLYAADDISNGGAIYSTDAFTFELGPLDTKTVLASGAEAGPNPFRTETTIRYEIAEAAEVGLRVYDVTGREVAALVNGTQEAGAHAATLRAGDLPAGVYVWRLTADGEVSTGRVTLAR